MTSWPELHELEVFLAVVEAGSIGGAARRLGISQPHASRIVSHLEQNLRAKVLERSPRGSKPTELGGELAGRSRQLLEAAVDFTTWFDTIRLNPAPATFSLGASLTIAETLVPTWLRQMRRIFPDVAVILRVLNSEEVIKDVREGTLDLGLVETPRLPHDLHQKLLGTDHLVVVVAPSHPWAGRDRPLSFAELAATALVVREKGSGTRKALDDQFEGQNAASPFQVLESNMAVRIVAASGAAPAALSELAVREQLRSGTLVQVPLAQQIPRPLTAIWQAPSVLPPAIATFVEIARNCLRQ